jgi:hypothetical protein
MSTYSFQDVVATITGLGGSIILGAGSGSAEEGITIEAVNDKNTMMIGADGAGQHSLSADRSSTVTVRLLKTSPVNAQLALMYEAQTASSLGHGKNTVVVRDVVRGDVITCTGVSFMKAPPLNYAKDGGINEWTFDAIRTVRVLGVGTPEV